VDDYFVIHHHKISLFVEHALYFYQNLSNDSALWQIEVLYCNSCAILRQACDILLDLTLGQTLLVLGLLISYNHVMEISITMWESNTILKM